MVEKIVEEIRIALENKLYFVALNSALTLPDICGKAEFSNMKTEDPARFLEAEWTGVVGSYNISVRVVGGESTPILVYVSNACTALGLFIASVNGRIDPKTHQSIVDFTIRINKKEDIDALFTKVSQNKDIIDIFRPQV